jgi:hypothetical protein
LELISKYRQHQKKSKFIVQLHSEPMLTEKVLYNHYKIEKEVSYEHYEAEAKQREMKIKSQKMSSF